MAAVPRAKDLGGSPALRCYEVEDDGNIKLCWEIRGWWEDSSNLYVSRDFKCLVRVCELQTKQVGESSERVPPDKNQPLLEFYRNGKLLKRVTVGEVVKDEDLVVDKSDNVPYGNPFIFYSGANAVASGWPLLNTYGDMLNIEQDGPQLIGMSVVDLIEKKLDQEEKSESPLFIYNTISRERLYFRAKTGELLHRYNISDKTRGIVREPEVDYPEVEWIEIPNGLVKPPAEQPGPAQPATQPADKPPVKDQPSTPTSKDAPR